MRLLDKYIVFSSIFALFTEDFTFHYGIDWKLFYLILLTNLILLALKKKLTLHKNIIIILGFFFLHGLIMFFFLKNPISSLVAQVFGIGISSLFYYNFIKIYGPKFLFEVYLKTAFVIAVIAIPMFYFKINIFTPDRLNGILSEPAHYATIMLPAIYVSLRDKKYLFFSVILITVLLSRSSVGYIGLALILFLPLLKIKYFLKYSIVVFSVLGISAYYIHTQWNKSVGENEGNVLVRRIKETKESLNSIQTGKFQKYTNLSSYALLSNAFIARKTFLEYPLGTGIGSYKHEYDKKYSLLTPPEYLIELKLSKINKRDASSMFLRVLADLGVFGLFLVLYFIYRSFKLFKNDKKIIEQSTIFYLAIKLLREGHYFPPEFYFFVLIFLKDFNEDITHR